ncbi:MAG: DNRLRE domain-containing protein [Azospirillum sp.]|nr:DNRLRE domain-containing protein [Azospirillum sp.]
MFRPMSVRFALGIAVVTSGFTPAFAVVPVVVMSADADATLIEDQGGGLANGAGAALFVGRTNQAEAGRRRALLHFDVAGVLPAGARITGVELELTVMVAAGGERKIAIYPVTTRWQEGPTTTAGGRGAAATAGDATWKHAAAPDQPWSAPGGDFTVASSAVATVGSGRPAVWSTTAALVADVQGWLDRPADNFGWLLQGDESQPQTAIAFASRETAKAAARPHLTVTFEPEPDR